MKLLVVVSSVKVGRVGRKVADWFVKFAKQEGSFKIDLVDLKELNLSYELPETNPGKIEDSEYERQEDRDWAKRVSDADAVVFVTPEYNHGYPASLKNAVDHLYREWNNKPVGFVGYGSAGAPYAIASFGSVAYWTKMEVVNAHVAISEVWSAFDDSGNLKNANYHEHEAESMLGALKTKALTANENE